MTIVKDFLKSFEVPKNVKQHCMNFNLTKYLIFDFNSLSANPTKWSNTLKQFVGKIHKFLQYSQDNTCVGVSF